MPPHSDSMRRISCTIHVRLILSHSQFMLSLGTVKGHCMAYFGKDDPLFQAIRQMVMETGKFSISRIQRKFLIGYAVRRGHSKGSRFDPYRSLTVDPALLGGDLRPVAPTLPAQLSIHQRSTIAVLGGFVAKTNPHRRAGAGYCQRYPCSGQWRCTPRGSRRMSLR